MLRINLFRMYIDLFIKKSMISKKQLQQNMNTLIRNYKELRAKYENFRDETIEKVNDLNEITKLLAEVQGYTIEKEDYIAEEKPDFIDSLERLQKGDFSIPTKKMVVKQRFILVKYLVEDANKKK